MNGPDIVVALVTGAVLALSVRMLLGIYQRYLFICEPYEILVVSGKKTKMKSGEIARFAVITAGRHFRIPFIQIVKRMDLRIIPIELKVSRILSAGGIPLDLHAIANVKLSTDDRFVYNAVERFLDLPIDNVRTAARQLLEGALRGVVSQLTPEQVNQDRIEFANKLVDMTEIDFNKMGLHLDTLKVLRVEDEAQYLVNLGRTQIANALRDAENAESRAAQDVALEEATARQSAEVAQKQADIGVSQKRNQLRTLTGQLEGQAQAVEREAKVAAEQARAEAEMELQTVRKEQQTRQLLCDVVLPAQANTRARELIAEGESASVRENGAANAAVIGAMTHALSVAGSKARELFVLSQLDALVAEVADKVQQIQVGGVHVIDSGDGAALPALAASYPASVVAVLGTLKDLTGVDVSAILSNQGAK
jgi:flotillin